MAIVHVQLLGDVREMPQIFGVLAGAIDVLYLMFTDDALEWYDIYKICHVSCTVQSSTHLTARIDELHAAMANGQSQRCSMLEHILIICLTHGGFQLLYGLFCGLGAT